MGPATAGLVSTGLKLVGGLFSKKPKSQPGQLIQSAAVGARKAAAESGFNPLTLLNSGHGQQGTSAGGGDGPPLASLSILGDFIEEKYGQDGEDRREHNRLTNELLTLQVQNARTLIGVAPTSAVAGIGNGPPAFNGGRAVEFLNEDDRNPPLADERDNTVSFQSHGQESVLPLGPDLDEVLTGVFIDANNRSKARKAREARGGGQTIGTPLAMPSTFPWSGDRMWEIMPPAVYPDLRPIDPKTGKPVKEWWKLLK